MARVVDPGGLERRIMWLEDGGTWGVPDSMSVFTIYKSRKAFSLKIGDRSHPVNKAIFKAFETLGWKEEKLNGEDRPV